MSTLAEMAGFICDELGVYDDTSIRLTKAFLNKEYKTLWDRYPWLDTEQTVSVTVPANTITINMPDGINRVISVLARNLSQGVAVPIDPTLPYAPDPVDPEASVFRADSRFLDPVDMKFLMESAPELLEQGGYVKYYEERRASTGFPGGHLRFYPTPLVDTEVIIMGKATCPGLVNDTDEPVIRNIDAAIIAYAYFDMLQRQRQYGKADLKRKEAQELEQVAWSLEQQQANQPRRTKATTVAGNSLAEMTDAVCTICGQWTPEYRLIIREFLRRNYQSLYDTYLWQESLVTVLMTYTGEQLILPYYVDRVLAVRSPGGFGMAQADGPLLFDLNPTVFEDTGEPISYTTLTPVGVSRLPMTTSQLTLASTSAIDTSNVAIRGEIILSGQELEETVTLRGTTQVTTQYAYDIPLTIAKDITVGTVTINANDVPHTLLGQLRPYWREKKYQRLWLLPNFDVESRTRDNPDPPSFKVMIMGKRAIMPLVSDQDTPIITGAQQVLIAAAAADLFRKLEKPDLANSQAQKASASTDVLKAKNTDQAASSPRFVPQCEPRAYVAGGVSGW